MAHSKFNLEEHLEIHNESSLTAWKKNSCEVTIIKGDLIFKSFLGVEKKEQQLQNEIKETSFCSAIAREKIVLQSFNVGKIIFLETHTSLRFWRPLIIVLSKVALRELLLHTHIPAYQAYSWRTNDEWLFLQLQITMWQLKKKKRKEIHPTMIRNHDRDPWATTNK